MDIPKKLIKMKKENEERVIEFHKLPIQDQTEILAELTRSMKSSYNFEIQGHKNALKRANDRIEQVIQQQNENLHATNQLELGFKTLIVQKDITIQTQLNKINELINEINSNILSKPNKGSNKINEITNNIVDGNTPIKSLESLVFEGLKKGGKKG